MAKRPRRQRFVCTHPGCCNFLGKHQGKYCGPEHKAEGKNAVQRLWSKTRPEASRRAA